MKFTRSIAVSLILALALCGAAKADPIIALASLLLAKKVTEKKSRNQFSNTTRWSELLSAEERDALERIQSHPAIHACFQSSQQGNPVAEYHLRKIAGFSVRLQQEIQTRHHKDLVGGLAYQRAAKAYDWCLKQAGMHVGDDNANMKQHARRLANLVLYPKGGVMLAMKENIE